MFDKNWIIIITIFSVFIFISPFFLNWDATSLVWYSIKGLSNPLNLYSEWVGPTIYAYPPFLSWFILGINLIYKSFNLTFQNFSWSALGIVPILFYKLILIFFLFILFLKIKSVTSLKRALLFLINPFILLGTILLGFWDIIPSTFLFISVIYSNFNKKPILASLFLGLALMTKENILPLVPIFLILIFNEYKKNNIKKFIICSLLIFLPLSISLIPYGESALNTFLKVYPLHKTDTFGIKLNTFEKVYTPSFSVSLNILLYILFAYYLLKNNKKLNYFLESSLFVLTIFYTLGMPSIWWAVLLIPLIFIFGEKNNFFLEYILLSTIFTIELYVNYVGNIDLSSPVGSLMKWPSFIIRPNILLMFENFYTILLTTKMAIGIIFLIKTLDYIFIKDKSVDK